MEVAPKDRQIFVKTVPPTVSRKELEGVNIIDARSKRVLICLKMFSQVEGFEYIALTDPAAKKSFHRVAWAQFANSVDVEAVVRRLDGQKVCGVCYIPTTYYRALAE